MYHYFSEVVADGYSLIAILILDRAYCDTAMSWNLCVNKIGYSFLLAQFSEDVSETDTDGVSSFGGLNASAEARMPSKKKRVQLFRMRRKCWSR